MGRANLVFRIARMEVASAGSRRSLHLLGGLLALLLLASTLVGWERFRTLDTQRARYQELVQAQWDGQPDRHPHRVAHYGYLAFRPKHPLSFFDFGVDSYTGTSVYLEAHRQNTANFSEARHAGGALRFGELSPAMVLQLLVPLLIFFLGFSSITRERESGTLALLLAQGVAWSTLLLGKVLGLLLVLMMLLAPGLLLAGVLLGVQSGWTLGGDLAARLALLGGAYGLYFAVCTAAAVLLSALHRSSRGALTTLVGLWIALWVVLPRAVPSLASGLHPAPAKAQFDAALERELREVGDGHNPNDPFFNSLRERYLAEYGASDMSALPINYGGVVMREAEALTARVYQEHHQRLLGIYRDQDRLSALASLLNPYLAIRGLSMAVAGTDAPHFAHFEGAAEAYRYAFVQRLNDLHIHEIRFENDRAQRVTREHWAEFPAFEYRAPPLRWALSHQPLHGVALLIWSVLMIGGWAWVSRRATVV